MLEVKKFMYYSVMLSKRLMDVSKRKEVDLRTFIDTRKNIQTMIELAVLYTVESHTALENTDYINIYDICWFLCATENEKISRQERTERAKIILNNIKRNNFVLISIMNELISQQYINSNVQQI